MKINTELGYVPVTFADLTDDDSFWKGCEGCVNFDVLKRTNRRYCICTAMLYDPLKPHDSDHHKHEDESNHSKGLLHTILDTIKKAISSNK